MKFEIKLKLLLWKYYFDKGFGLSNSYIKYPLALFALYEVVLLKDVKVTIILGLFWVSLSFIIGWTYYKYRWNEADIEIVNRINPFVREMREKFK